MAWLAAVGAEVGFSTAATLFIGKDAAGPARAVQIHGDMRLEGRGGRGTRSLSREGWRLVGGVWLGVLLAAGEVGSHLVLFDGDGGGDVTWNKVGTVPRAARSNRMGSLILRDMT